MSNLAAFIKIIHAVLIIYIVATPFTNSEWWLTLHAIMMPGLIIHWITNNNTCSLTLLESQLTGQSMDNTFIGQIAYPFFKVNNYMIYTIVIGLWFLSLYKLQKTNFRLLKYILWKTWDLVYKLVTGAINAINVIV